MIGALDEGAMSIANADDPQQEKADVRNVIHSLIEGLLSDPDRAASARDPALTPQSGPKNRARASLRERARMRVSTHASRCPCSRRQIRASRHRGGGRRE